KEVRINGKIIEGLISRVTVNSGNLDKIVIEWKTDDTAFVTQDKDLEMPGFSALKLSMAEMNLPTQETIVVEPDGSASIFLRAPIKSGEAKFNILYSDSNGQIIGFGKDSERRLVTSESNTLAFNETRGDKWFVASWSSARDAESYLLSAKVSSKDNTDRVTIKNEVTGSNICIEGGEGGRCSIGDLVLTVNEIHREGSDKWATFTISSGGSFNTLYTKEGMKIYLPYELENSTSQGAIEFSGEEAGHNSESFNLYFSEEDKDNRIAAGETFYLTIASNNDGRLQVKEVKPLSEKRIADSDRYEYYVVSDLATKIVHDRGGNQDRATVTYYGDQVFAEVFLTQLKAEVIPSESKSPVKELGSVYVSDLQISPVASKNRIVVGGSCVNSYAAKLIGGNFCGEEWEEKTGVGSGEFIIQTFNIGNGKTATLVAGYNAADTTNAVKALKTKSNDLRLVPGMKYIGTSSTSVNLVES
ncbi:MAG: hypothetical protein ABIH92_05435, partial [Nanoarchaeota archaeon]